MKKPKPVNKASVSSSEAKKVLLVNPESSQQLEPEEIVVIPPDNHIILIFDSISNIIPVLNSRESALKIRLQLGDSFVLDSQVICFSDSLEKCTSIGWSVRIPCFTSETMHLDFLTTNPVVISVAEVAVNEFENMEQSSNVTADVQRECLFIPFAFCTLDLLPLILGEPEIRQTLLLDIHRKTAKKDTNSKSPITEKSSGKGKDKSINASKETKKKSSKSSGTSKDKDEKEAANSANNKDNHTLPATASEPPSVDLLPQINLSASVEKSIMSREIVKESNVVFITLESIHNLPESFDGEFMDFQAATLIPNEFDNEQVVRFGEGIFKRECNNERLKRWINADKVPGRGACTQYSISDNLFAVRNKLGVDLCQVMSSDGPRVEWNKLKRSWISSSGVEYLSDYVHKHTTWMLEVMATPKAAVKRTKGQKGEDTTDPSENFSHFVAFFDISKLTYPGTHSVRCVAQLFTYCKEDVMEKCGSRSQTLLSPPPEKNKANKGVKTKTKADKKGKSVSDSVSQGTKKGASKNKGAVEVPPESPDAPAEVVPCVATPWVNEEGEPVFVLLELELLRPLTARITDEELFDEVDRQIPPKPKVSPEILAAKKAGEEHTALIHRLTRLLTKEYHSFLVHRRSMKLSINVGDQHTRDFYQFLKETGTIALIKGQLSTSIDVLIKTKFGYDISKKSDQDVKVKHKFVSELYVRMFEDLNTIINTVIDTVTEPARPIAVPESQMRMLGVEARTLGFSSRQRKLYLENLRQNDADRGTQFLFEEQCDELNSALQHTLHVLVEDRDSKEALLLYAVLLTKKADMKNAELFLRTMIAKNPYSLFSGYLFRLFYLMAGNKTAAEVVWETTRKLTFNKPQPVMDKVFDQMLDWDANMYDLKTVHLKCIQLLLYVRIFTLEFTYLALEEELKQYGPSEPYYYFLAVCHFRSRRYQEACSILEDILEATPRLEHIRRLLAHCQYEMGCREDAMRNYAFVVETSLNGMANHLVHIRLGDHYLDCGDFDSAKSVFFESCCNTPTAKSWLGVGIACYMQGDYKESEDALAEANYLDRTMSLVWGYLTLLNLQLCRPGPFEQCYCRAFKYNLADKKVIGMIEDLIHLQGFTKPKLIHSDTLI